MKIIEILSRDAVKIGMISESKEHLLEQMVDLAEKSGKIKDKSAILNCVVEREKIMSTGIGKNVALPHAKTDLIDEPLAAMAILKDPIDFESLDGEPISICFLLLGKENNVGVHLRLLSKISRFLNNDDFREKVLACQSPDELLDLFKSAEE